MTVLTNYHTHTTFCDGKAEPEEFVQAAVERGFKALGFSAHAPAPAQEDWTMAEKSIPNYMEMIRELGRRYSGTIEIYLGMEVDYISGILGPSSPSITELQLDYILGGLHIIPIDNPTGYPTIDGPEDEYLRIKDRQFNGDPRAVATHYFQLLGQLVQEHRFDILAHFDLIKVPNKGGRYYSEDEQWYRDAVLAVLDVLAGTEVIVEINTGGLSRGKSDTLYPSPWILKEARSRDIPIMINSDVHIPDGIDAMFSEARAAALNAGYETKRVLLEGVWQDISL